ncbi:MAG TPA: ABC-F family ATP-binding cassette domain-containing protein [Cyclobacteriaceae bacterium]|nr:ABC-F family ATP-binding cassette domain-containing protein [Cyclobacteriaceae bacterium]
MLSISNLSYYAGTKKIFDHASLNIGSRDAVGLVGLNGSGKTTLLRIIAGECTPDEGVVTRSNDSTIGYLNQDMLSLKSEKPIVEVVMEAFDDIVNIEHRIAALSEKISRDYDKRILNEISALQDKYELNEGYRIHSKAQEILQGVGFRNEDHTRPMNEFSGGWRMRVVLAKLLLEQPNLLMLDEPTNHLDLPAIQWLENYLKSYKGALIIVSHDQLFLNNIINITVEVASLKLNTYQGNYSFFMEQKELRTELQQNAYTNQQKMIKDTRRFINRFRAKSSKARQVQSRIKSLEKIDLIEEVSNADKLVSFRFKTRVKPGRHILQLKNITKNFDSLRIFHETGMSVEKGDKIALIGANGEGKSTLLRILANTEEYSGYRKTGHNVTIAFYAQHQLESLNLGNDLITELADTGSQRTDIELRTLLGCFLFSGDEIYKKIKVLSGGEKARIALAKVILSDANFLLLDEPTNHLDYYSIGILKNALVQYDGTYVLVSHDRQFIEDVCNKIWYIRDYQVKEYPGKLSEYLASGLKNPVPALSPKSTLPKKPHVKRMPIKRNDQKEYQKKERALKKTIGEIDQVLEQLEVSKKNIETDLGKTENYADQVKLAELITKLNEVNREIELKQKAWMETFNELEKFSSGNF